ncbi:DeoR/GlpR transcriptional regulator [Clostridiales bacterium COT073_COT-073]|nr:DeoR/GlpR transcriptional regulator [Clostridiales bacterium COT073_COT-073]
MNTPKKAQTRQAKIRDMLQKKDIINIQEFCEKLDVSIATIRNDLATLEKNGYLKRVLGGAISTEGTPRNTMYSSRVNLNKAEKKKIAEYAVTHYLRNDMTIVLDAGTTNHFIAEQILESDLSCRVITNAFNIVSLFSKVPNIEVISAGGKLDKDHNAFHDQDALYQLKKYHADIYFLSPNGIDINKMITSSAKDESEIKKFFISSAKKTVVVADYSKFGKSADYFLTNFASITCILTDDKLDNTTYKLLSKIVKIKCI